MDGSDGADAAFAMVKKDLYREHQDFMSVGHIRDVTKTYLSWHFKPEYIQETYSTKLLDIGKEGEFLMIDKQEDKTTKECLFDLARARKADVICTSMTGRKGLKE